METVKFPLKFLVSHRKYGTELEYILEILPKCGCEGPWIAGGSLLRTYTERPITEDSDFDVFFQNEAQANAYINTIKNASYEGSNEDRKTNHYVVTKTEKTQWHTTITLNYLNRLWKIQCVSFVFFKSISDLFDSFDFDLCMLAYDGNEITASKSTFDSIQSKKGKLLKINFPSVTLKRLVKYMRQGYDFDDADVAMLSKSFSTEKAFVNVFGNDTADDDKFVSKHTSQNSSDYRNVSHSGSTSQNTNAAAPMIAITGSYIIKNPHVAINANSSTVDDCVDAMLLTLRTCVLK